MLQKSASKYIIAVAKQPKYKKYIQHSLNIANERLVVNNLSDERLVATSNNARRGKIPYIIHLIWFGDNFPIYAENVVEEYLKLNPSFIVNLVHKPTSSLKETTDDQLLEEAKQNVNQIVNGNNIQTLYSNKIKAALQENMPISQIIIDIYRFMLLDKFGGIYVDFDTWPLVGFRNVLDFTRTPVLLQKVLRFVIDKNVYKENNIFTRDKELNPLVFESKTNLIQFFDDFVSSENATIARWLDIFLIGIPKNGFTENYVKCTFCIDTQYPLVLPTYYKFLNYTTPFVEQYKNFMNGIKVDSTKLSFYKKYIIVHFNNVDWIEVK